MRYLLVRLKASARLLRSNKFRLFGAPEFSIPASAGEASCSFIISPGLPMNAVRVLTGSGHAAGLIPRMSVLLSFCLPSAPEC